MITPKYFIENLHKNNINFFAGVPDSLLKNICAYITDNLDAKNNIITANEGAAIGLAAGYYLATQKIPVVYMQNSGIGNAVNPLMSLIDKEVYNIPLLMLIGWRGEPGVKDEPQHIKQGKVTIPILDAMGIKNIILSHDELLFKIQLQEALRHIQSTQKPVAFVIQKGTFDNYTPLRNQKKTLSMSRESAIQIVADSMNPDSVVVSTTGMISRELFEYRTELKEEHERDFLTVGSMGHASQIALGIALQQPARTIYCFDGDGAVLMHMGSLPIIGSLSPKNYIHVIFNNGAHDSVGGQPTVGLEIDFAKIALASGYSFALSVDNKESLFKALKTIKDIIGPVLLEIKVKCGARDNLCRPSTTPIENKKAFMTFLNPET